MKTEKRLSVHSNPIQYKHTTKTLSSELTHNHYPQSFSQMPQFLAHIH